ncbi:3-beta hydroxysteroid dehydrogenase [Candidatus Roizmanbacteria bacterium CG10_big_fil_rev_8_21_14_0_10_45_7]|uniref:3-beta hydroxysteroid dehydrogenase n=1 Tax=Candidatus Roizmanbacteria bacterium CG10_big_fil_rev_8_21_14_0_10_45_7 TaxID=1974854 RepID=A0A2M8KV47_9BACT|nr:MAG: 3-beta hydroxysteroid dehydrogenase [Candidatus Roizmanbacteria bacterium CG10_big_fil_rev_8_21_14_0_10_45_7]
MNYRNFLITGGAGFVGSNIALRLMERYPHVHITVLDNLKRRGSELNIGRLQQRGITFIHGDIRAREDLDFDFPIDCIIECSAEPSVLAGVHESPRYLLHTNLVGSLNCFEVARTHHADVIFLSTSRVYPIHQLNELRYAESPTRFTLRKKQPFAGASAKGITEDFPLDGARSLYGSSKLASELILQEYIDTYHIQAVINRCGVITGPWQMGKIDQGVIVLWMARHIWPNKKLSYIGYGGKGKQVRDFIHIDDLFDVLDIQLSNMKAYNGHVFNIGGGLNNSLSLCELTQLCRTITGNTIPIRQQKRNRENDVRIYISDYSKFHTLSRWVPKRNAQKTLEDIYAWIKDHQLELSSILQ